MREYIEDRATAILNQLLDNYAEEDRDEEVDTIRDDVMVDDELRNFRPSADEEMRQCARNT